MTASTVPPPLTGAPGFTREGGRVHRTAKGWETAIELKAATIKAPSHSKNRGDGDDGPSSNDGVDQEETGERWCRTWGRKQRGLNRRWFLFMAMMIDPEEKGGSWLSRREEQEVMVVFDGFREEKAVHCNWEEETIMLMSKQEKRSCTDGACFSSTMAMRLTCREKPRGTGWWLRFREENEQDEVRIGMTDREGRDGEGFDLMLGIS